MADTVISGTSGNDVLAAGGGGTLTLLVSASIAENTWPIINVLVNGSVVMGSITVTADHSAGSTQLVTVPIAAGTSVGSVGIEYTNDPQTDGFVSGDRNVYLSSVNLDGTELLGTSSTYLRTANNTTIDGQQQFINGQEAMVWGGTLTYSGTAVQSAAANGGAGGSVLIDGGAGIDTAVFGGTLASYAISHTANGYLVGSTELVNVERAQFADTKLALDMNGNGGTAVELIAALFGPSAVGVKGFVGAVLGLLDGGMSEEQLANLAIHTSLFQQMAGSSSNTDFVRLVVHNLIGVDPSQQLLNTLVGVLDNGTLTQASFAVIAADSSFNAVHLVGVMQNGVEFA